MIQIKNNLGQFNSCKYELIIDCIKKNQLYFKFINKVDLKSKVKIIDTLLATLRMKICSF